MEREEPLSIIMFATAHGHTLMQPQGTSDDSQAFCVLCGKTFRSTLMSSPEPGYVYTGMNDEHLEPCPMMQAKEIQVVKVTDVYAFIREETGGKGIGQVLETNLGNVVLTMDFEVARRMGKAWSGRI